MTKAKSNIKKFSIFFTSINAITILILTSIFIYQINNNNLFLKETLISNNKKYTLNKTNYIHSYLSLFKLDSLKDLKRQLRSILKKDSEILNISIFSKTSDENYFKVKSTLKIHSLFKIPYKRNQIVNNESQTTFLKEGIFQTTFDPNLYTDKKLFWHNIYTPIKLSNSTYVLKFAVNHSKTGNILKKHLENNKEKKELLSYTVIIFIILLLIVSLLYMNIHSVFVNKLAKFVEKASKGDLNLAINSNADNDMSKLANSFNTLIEDLKDKEKKIKNLEKREEYSEIFKHGVQQLKNKKYNDAITIFTTITILKPNGFASYFNLGIAYIKNKDFHKSIYNFNKALSLNPEHDITKNYLDKIYKMKSKHERNT